MADRSVVAEQIEALLAARGWTAARLAQESGVNESTISNIIRGTRRSPQGETVRKLAQGFGVSVDVLYGETGMLVADAEKLPEYAMQVVEQMRKLDARYNYQLLLFAEAMIERQDEMRMVDAVSFMRWALRQAGKEGDFREVEDLLRRLESRRGAGGLGGIDAHKGEKDSPKD